MGCGKGTVDGLCIRKVSIDNKHCGRVGGGLGTSTMRTTRVVRKRRPVGSLHNGAFASSMTLGLGLGPRIHSG